MLCSTVIPTIDRPSFDRALKSALEQDLDPDLHEIIVVNDSGNPLRDRDCLRSPQISIVNTNKTERSVACNTGAAIAKGKYINILQDDDYLLAGALRELINVAETTGSYWVYGALNRVDDDDRFMSLNRPDVEGNIFGHSVAGDAFHLSASLIRRDIFFLVGCFDSQINTSEDIDLQCRIALMGDIGRTDQIVAGIRVGTWGNTSTKWNQKKKDSRIVREKALSYPGAFIKIRDSVWGDVNLRGRCCRAYSISAVLNLQNGRPFNMISRLLPLIPLAGFYIFYPKFWRGYFSRSHWHKFEKAGEEAHYAKHHPDKYTEAQEW